MTQLAAMLIVPFALAFAWLLVRGAKTWRRTWWVLAIIVAGMFLVHVRVFLLFLPFAGLVWLLSAGRNWRTLALAAALAILLVSPRIIQLIADTSTYAVFQSIEGYNDFPVGYVTVGWERAYLVLGGIAVLIIAWAGLRSRFWVMLPLFLAAWVGLVAFLLYSGNLGLPQTYILNLNSAYISLFLPLAWLLAIAADRIWRWILKQDFTLRAAATLLAGVGLALLLLFGIHQQITILNSQTILAEDADVAGLAWLEKNLPPETRLATSSWLWLGQIWAASDGGAWIVPLTGLQSTIPPADYTYDDRLFRQVNDFNVEASTIQDWSDPAAADWLRHQGVSYIYVGARGGFFDPSTLAKNPSLIPVFSRNGVFIFEVQQPT
jgi:hypothetical protein